MTRIIATSKSKHAGQTGTVIADYGNMLLIKTDDESYSGAHKSSERPGKYFQVDSRWIKELKDAK